MSNLYELACTVPWCITDEALEAMLAIAAREPLDADDLAHRFHGPKSLALRDGQRRDDSERMAMQGGVALISIDGPIYRYADFFTKVSGGVTTEALAKDFQRALDDPAVTAILFVLDSPGGEATGINELADTIYAARGQKPIGAYIEGYGASAAYWIASAADRVTVDDNALVGSIGTVMAVPDLTKRPRYTIDFVSSQSPKKRVDPASDVGRTYLQTLVDDMTEVFIAKVMRNRRMTREQVLAVEGGLRIGQQAVAASLADALGSEGAAVRELAALALKRVPFSVPGRLPGQSPLRMEESMQLFSREWWGNLFSGAADAQGETTAVAPTRSTFATLEAGAAPIQMDQDATETDARIAELERQLAEQRTQQIQAAAVAFADGAVRDHQALPAERQALYDAYVQAAQDDSAGRAQGATRVQRLEALVWSRPVHNLTVELVPSGQGGVLNVDASGQPMSEGRRQTLLAMTPTGQAVLQRRRRARSA